MKNLKYIWLSVIALLSVGFVSCNDDDEYFDGKYQDRPIVVNKVYLENYESSVPDREVEFARLGQLIRLEGSGFMGMKKVFVNGFDTYFNRAYVSDNSMLIQLNSKTPITDAEDDVRNTIRLVKDGTQTVHNFTIRAASPSIKGLQNALPAAGELVVVHGEGLQEITKVTLPGGVEITDGITSDKDGEWYSFTMPSGLTAGGAIVAEGANGISQTPAYFNERRGMLLDFDTEGQQGAWGWKEAGSMIGFEDRTDDDGNVTMENDLVQDPLGTNGQVCQIVPDRLLTDGGIVSGKPRVTECWTVGDGNLDYENWARMSALIPADTPLDEVAFQFEIYVPNPWGATGQLQICLVNNYQYKGIDSDEYGSGKLTAFFIPWVVDGKNVPFSTEGWTTVTIPLSEFGKYKALLEDKEAVAPTFQTVIDDRLAATYPNFGMGFVNTDYKLGDAAFPSDLFNTKIYVDNWRIVPCKNVVISDYPEDDEEE